MVMRMRATASGAAMSSRGIRPLREGASGRASLEAAALTSYVSRRRRRPEEEAMRNDGKQ